MCLQATTRPLNRKRGTFFRIAAQFAYGVIQCNKCAVNWCADRVALSLSTKKYGKEETVRYRRLSLLSTEN